jgi:hypothetical protein
MENHASQEPVTSRHYPQWKGAEPMYFDHLSTVGDVKTEYRRLAKLHHPDLGGDTATMQSINAAYHAKLESLNGQTSTGFDGKEHTYYYKQQTEQAVMDKISELLGLNLSGCTVELVGVWVWVYGEPDREATRPHSAALKEAGCIWHGKRKRWYWRQNGYRRRKYRGTSFSDLRTMHGSRVFNADDTTTAPAPA